jgi:peptide/nickel transport system substrate-binding protein
MIEGAGKGTVPKSGYSAGKHLNLVRNPSWDKSKDYRPAYLNEIHVKVGGDATVVSRKILQGKGMLSGDYAAPPTPVLKQALSRYKDQLHIEPSQSNRYISLNTKVKPLEDPNVRKALAAVTDRTRLRQTRGGETLGPLATHFIPPEMPGFEEAGGEAGPGYDFYKSPTGDVELAKEYMRKAGFKNGMYDGPPLLVAADNQAPAKQTAEAWQDQVAKIGFKMNLRLLPHATVIGKFCGTPKMDVAICPTLGWGKDFFDSQSMLDPVFNGKNIVPSGNVNHSQTNDPKINAALDKAATITDPAQRAKAYGEIDRKLTGQVPVIVWLWDNQINFASDDVKGVRSKFNSSWDLTYTSLK